jgi:hypothetical protein
MAAVAAHLRAGCVEDLQLQHHVHLRHDAHQQQAKLLSGKTRFMYLTLFANAAPAAKPSALSTASARFFPLSLECKRLIYFCATLAHFNEHSAAFSIQLFVSIRTPVSSTRSSPDVCYRA